MVVVRQVILDEPNTRLQLVDVPMPIPAADEVLIRTTVACVCSSTDRNIIAGIHPPHSSGIAGMQPHDLCTDVRRSSATELSHFYPPAVDSAWSPYPAVMGHEAAGDIVAIGSAANADELVVQPAIPLRVGDRVAAFKVYCGFAEYAAISSANVVRLPSSLTYEDGSLLDPSCRITIVCGGTSRLMCRGRF
jgi:NADPH:quinone reductase-like Zn-dependent oxidoreductase